MAATTDEALERRRVQNRMAQRRFRQRRQDYRNPTKLQIDQQAVQQQDMRSVALDIINFETNFEDFLLEAEEPLLVSPSGSPKMSNRASTQYDQLQQPDMLNFEDLNRSFTAHAINALSLASATSMALNGALGAPIAVGINCEALSQRPEQVRRVSRDQIPKASRTNSTDLIELSNFNSSSTSNTSTGTSSPNTGQSASPRSAGSTSGWVSALHIAAQKGHSGIVQVLLQQNADSNEPDSDGLTPLMHAALGGHDDVARVLLAHGANLGDLDCHRRSALHWAVIAQREGLLRLLLEHATKHPFLIDAYDDIGRTPLHTAVDSGFESGVAALLEYGANLYSRARKT